MLNRLYIVIGLLAILAIGAAFVVPRFIEWGDYRDRMQAIAAEVFGAPVEIVGDIEFSLLPQPQLRLSEVRVGAVDAPVITVAEVEAQFSLVDFLRDKYVITKLVLGRPNLAVNMDAKGGIEGGIALPEQVTTSNISVANAEIVDGTVTLTDARSGQTFVAGNVDGEVRMDALRGPFAFQGSGDFDGRNYVARVATAAMDGDGAAPLSVFLRPADERFSLSAEGVLQTQGAPAFSGSVIYRQAPALTGDEEIDDAGQGDLVVSGKLEASAARILLSDYTIVPDENRAGTRLNGAAEVQLGRTPKFNAVISGGVLALPPRDATTEQANLPYELVRLLSELPLPSMPGLPGTIGVDIAEIDLRAVSLRNVRFDAAAGNEAWTIKSFEGQLPGGTGISLAGELSVAGGKPNFAGTIKVATDRLDALAQLWRKPPDGNPLFNMPGSFESRISLVGETLSLSEGVLTLDGSSHEISAEIGFASATRHLNVNGRFGALDEQHSAALAALLPEVTSDGRFAVTFPKGRFDIAAKSVTIAGLPGTDVSAVGSWEGGVLALDELSAADLGGAALEAKLTAFGTFALPELSGSANIRLASEKVPVLTRFYDLVGTPQHVRDFLARSLPADLALRLDAPTGEGGQGLAISGRAGVADVTLEARLGMGVARALGGPKAILLDLQSDDPAGLTAQLGLGQVSLVPEDQPMHLVAVIEGNAANSFETTVRVEGGGDSLAFAGNVLAGDLTELSGNGTLRAALSDLSALTDTMGAGGIWLPPVNGSANIDFAGLRRVRLDAIDAVSGGGRLTGALEWTQAGETSVVSGELGIGSFDPQGFLSLLAGPAATLRSGAGFWPDGPLAVGDGPRWTSGRVAITAPALNVAGKPLVTGTSFDVVWDATSLRIRDFAGSIGGGKVALDLGVCCAGPLPQKQVSGRVALEGVALDSVVPRPVADALSARVSVAARFAATGDSMLSVLSEMTGEGSYTLDQVVVEGLDPGAFADIASLDTILELEPDALSKFIIDRLDDNAFLASEVSGGFTVAGGVLRSPNLAIDGEGARLFGSSTMRLADLGLEGGFVMSSTAPAAPNALLIPSNAQVAANLGGTLQAPQRTFDVAGLVDAIMVRAYEIEVARLEQLRAEDEARQRAAAEERARIAAEEAERKAAEEEAARLAAEEEAARLAAEEEAARLAAEEEAARLAAEEEAARLAAEEEAARMAAEEEARRRAAEQESTPQVQLQPGFNLNFVPEPSNNQF